MLMLFQVYAIKNVYLLIRTCQICICYFGLNGQCSKLQNHINIVAFRLNIELSTLISDY